MLETLAKRLAKVKAYSVCETLGDVLANPRVTGLLKAFQRFRSRLLATDWAI